MSNSMSYNELIKKLENKKEIEENILEKSAEAIDSNSENSYNTNIKIEEQEFLNTPDAEMLEKIAQARDLGIVMAREAYKEFKRLTNQ